VTACHL